MKTGSGSGVSRQGKAREHKKRRRTQSEQDERVDKLSLLLASAEEEARGHPPARHACRISRHDNMALVVLVWGEGGGGLLS